MTRHRQGNPARAGWDPITVGTPNPQNPIVRAFLDSDGRRHHYWYRENRRAVGVQAFGNRLYDGIVLHFDDNSMHLSFKRRDRAAVRDWRHFQAIKNEVAGPDREAIEIYPREDNLLDAANEYHLWVLPAGVISPLGFAGPAAVNTDGWNIHDHAAYRQGGPPSGRQRPMEPGLPVGPQDPS